MSKTPHDLSNHLESKTKSSFRIRLSERKNLLVKPAFMTASTEFPTLSILQNDPYNCKILTNFVPALIFVGTIITLS